MPQSRAATEKGYLEVRGMQGAPAERFSWLYVSPRSNDFRPNSGQGICSNSTMHRTCTFWPGVQQHTEGLQPWWHWIYFAQMKEWAEILPLGNGCTAEMTDNWSLMLCVTTGKTGKEGEFGLTFPFRKSRDSLVCRAVVCLWWDTYVCPLSLMISKYRYMVLMKHLKAHEPLANWPGVPTHSIIWTPNTLKCQASVKETKLLIWFQWFSLPGGKMVLRVFVWNSGSEETLQLPTSIHESQNITCLLNLYPPSPSL